VRPAHRPASTIPVGALAQDQPGQFAPLLLGERRPEFLDRALSFAVRRCWPRSSSPARWSSVWVPENVRTTLDLLLRRQPATGMIRRWRSS
jgi:hypothetical protein